MNAINRAINIVGNQSKLALAVGVTQQAVQKWASSGKVPPEKVIPIAQATGWQVTPHDLRSDLYPHPLDGMPRDTAA
jgi:DNA-binding transcriptional regulator YdaS (Cro superfamily)